MGAEISDIEFVQFHPTALYLEGAPRFLLSEALRGEGAVLRNRDGERFMEQYHPLAELAPRDVVSRSIVSEMRRTGARHVFLDLTHREPGFVSKRFPRIYQTCFEYGIDLERQPAPVHPAAHYSMGGVRTGLDGCSSVAGLYAAGEVACTGVHGANRLASNSLLEGLVFGARAGVAMREAPRRVAIRGALPEDAVFPRICENDIRLLASEECGILRSGEGLAGAVERLQSVACERLRDTARAHHELRSIHTLALLIARCALARRESRGGHYRIDYPEKKPEFQKHSVVSKGRDVAFV
jgi:L-aspartate oxidase